MFIIPESGEIRKQLRKGEGEWEILMRVIGSGHIGVQIR